METPQDRFIQVARWYLSAFHAGRKSSVAKKPYNPILGETFKCHWDVPNYESKQSVSTTVLSNHLFMVYYHQAGVSGAWSGDECKSRELDIHR